MTLTPRQRDCAKLIISGFTAKEIAAQLNLSFRTVEGYIEILKRKYHARNKAALVATLLLTTIILETS
jgi:LuxR family quorum-sensing system transcriptional regulator SolR